MYVIVLSNKPSLQSSLQPLTAFSCFQGESIYRTATERYYRQSHARHVIENAFGILVSRWHIFRLPIEASTEKVEKYTLAVIVLLIYLRHTDTNFYTPFGFIDSEGSSGKIKKDSRGGVFQYKGAHAKNVIPKFRNSGTKNFILTIQGDLAKYLIMEEGQVQW